MQHPPVRSAQHAHTQAILGTRVPQPGALQWDVCCAPAPKLEPAAASLSKRARLGDLDANLHCSIIGTCLPTSELRKLVPRFVPSLDRKHSTDLHIHHTAVELTTGGHPVAKELTKTLDTRHAIAIKRFRTVTDEQSLKLLWQKALASGDVPGAYWALLTHPAATFDVRALAFGDVHMLSHLVGASNRADIRRLAALEEENEQFREQSAHQQQRLHALTTQHASTIKDLQQQLGSLQSQLKKEQLSGTEDSRTQVAQLRAALAEQDQKLALHVERHSETEQKLLAEMERNVTLQATLQDASDGAAAARRELDAVEQTLQKIVTTNADSSLPAMTGKCVLYVGGRPGATDVIQKLVAAAGGELLVHDGGIEDRRGLLSSMLPRAHVVVFPVDFISHNAMHVTKQTCARHGIACHPMRSASVASFVELMYRLHRETATSRP